MAGYLGHSMSNNAVSAYENGLRPASKISGIPAKLIRQFCSPDEWHHSSKLYNKVDFYDPEYVQATFGLIKSDDYEADDRAIQALTDWKASRKTNPERKTYQIKFSEWIGHGRRARKTEYDLTVEGELKGDWFTFNHQCRLFRKNIHGNNINRFMEVEPCK